MDNRSPIEIMLRLHWHFIRFNAMISDSVFWMARHFCIVQNKSRASVIYSIYELDFHLTEHQTRCQAILFIFDYKFSNHCTDDYCDINAFFWRAFLFWVLLHAAVVINWQRPCFGVRSYFLCARSKWISSVDFDCFGSYTKTTHSPRLR